MQTLALSFQLALSVFLPHPPTAVCADAKDKDNVKCGKGAGSLVRLKQPHVRV